MKKISTLPGCLRLLFGLAQLLLLISGIFWSAAFGVSLAPRTYAVTQLPFNPVFLEIPPALLTIKSPTSNEDEIRITHLSTTLFLNPQTTNRDLAAAIRWTLLPNTIFIFAFYWLLFGRLRKLCARAEEGEIFSEANLRSIRNLGLLIVTGSVIDGGLHLWATHRLGGYLVEHTTITGINATLTTGTMPILKFPFNDFITGLLIILLAEAFRQGLALKKENDLTI